MPGATSKTDVCILGGGPAGLAAAIAVRRAGLQATVIDHAYPPINKACGEGIMPDGIAALARLGVRLDVSQSVPFSGIRFINDQQQVEASFSSGVGLGLRRTLLHQQLVEAAVRAGVQIIWGGRLIGISESRVLLDGQNIACRWIVGADGQNSRVRFLSGLDRILSERSRFGFRQHYRVAPWSNFVEVHWADCGQVYITPVGENTVCLAFITALKSLRMPDAIDFFPALACRLKNAIPEGPVRGAITVFRRLEKVCQKNVALIGEAAGSVDAITGEGLAIAFHQAIALADALKTADLASYQAAHERILRLPRIIATLMLNIGSRAAFRRRMFQALDSQPETFARMLAVHTGTVSPMNFGVANTLSLGWRLVAAKS